jgi:hypothetical protein
MTFGDLDWWRLAEVVGVWLAAFATLAATLVALHVSTRDTRQQLRVLARQSIYARYPDDGSRERLFAVTATNVGHRAATVAGVGVRCWWPHLNSVVLVPLPGSASMNETILDGQSARWLYPLVLEDGSSFYSQFADILAKENWFRRRVIVARAKWYVETSLGNVFFDPRNRQFWSCVIEEMKNGGR